MRVLFLGRSENLYDCCYLFTSDILAYWFLFSFPGSVKTVFEDELGVVDLHLSNKSCVLYVSESDLVVGNDYKRKIVRFRNVSMGVLMIYLHSKRKIVSETIPGS